MTKKFDLSPQEQLALARATIDKLETQRQETIERRSEILGQERELTYHALGAGDAQAKEKLTKLEVRKYDAGAPGGSFGLRD